MQENSDISTVDKMNHLRSLLKADHEATRLVLSLPLSKSNYIRAVDLLQQLLG